MEDALTRIEQWYASQCDGSWEHQYGLRIETIDNPGWRVHIDLSGTQLRYRTLDEMSVDRTETNWLRWRAGDGKFEGFGGPGNLKELLHKFLEWGDQGPDDALRQME
jgi:hypothetical protein